MTRRTCIFRDDVRGTVLIEFAFVVPILVLLLVGGFQLMDAISCYRKVTTTVRTMADLTTRYSTVSEAKINDILNASGQVMTPYSTSSASMRITEVYITSDLKPMIVWSRPFSLTAYLPGQAVVVPDKMKQANTYLIYSEMNFAYVPPIGKTMVGTINLKDQIFMSPRVSPLILLTP